MKALCRLDHLGIEWMGDPPATWPAHPVKRHFDVLLGRMLQNEPASPEDRSVPYMKALHVKWGRVDTDDLPEMWASPRDLRQYGIQSGDLLVCEGGEAGRCGIVGSPPPDCIIQYSLHRVRAMDTASVRFLKYVLHAVDAAGWFDVLCNRATIAHFTREKLADLRIPVPTLDEQRTIVHVLDRETARIDALIDKKRRQIELLHEKRAALISHAVTKGLDSNAPMKDSDIDWLGEVPKHWQVLQLRRVVDRFIDYRGRTPSKTSAGVPLVTAGAVKDGVIDHSLAPEYMAEEDYTDWMSRGLPEVGDVVITTEAPLAEVAQVQDPRVAFAQRIILFKVNRTRMLPSFLRYYYLSGSGKSELLSRASGSTATGIRSDRLRMSLVLVPPLEEQRRIAAHLDRLVVRLTLPVMHIESSIETLREYRMTLISAAVTGKMDVRQEVA